MIFSRITPCDFNPRSREGSDNTVRNLSTVNLISIHAPVKGATRWRLRQCGTPTISIHAPVKGATVGGNGLDMNVKISIHAPVKGATRVWALLRVGCSISIHAPVKGATTISVTRAPPMMGFQSTLP